MSESRRCPDCGTELPADAPASVCPKCLLQAGLNEASDPSASEETFITGKVNPADVPTLVPSDEITGATASPDIGTNVRYFGDYELLDEIARGGMGVVYKARQVRLNRTVALKMILAGQFAGKADVQRFQTEAEAAAQLDHGGIVPVFEVGEHEGHHFFSMGLVEGESLAQRIADRPLAPKESAEIVRKIVEAIAYAHERGVIHRDLKPANVLIDRDGQPKVTDFGLAKRIEGDSHLTASGQILGTPSYMPPEQAAGRVDQVNEAADIYSLGAILYATLTGRPPFQSHNALDTVMQVLEREPPAPRTLNPKVPLDLETICLKCLEKDRRRRYGTAQELADELNRFLDDRPILARPIGRLARMGRWCRRNPVVASLIAAFVISLIGGAAFSTYYGIEAHDRAVGESEQRELAEKREKEATEQRDIATAALATSRRDTYALQLSLVSNVCERDPFRGLELLQDDRRCPPDLRDFVWGFYHHQCRRENEIATSEHSAFAFSADSQSVFTISWSGTYSLDAWNVLTGESLHSTPLHPLASVAFPTRGNTAASWHPDPEKEPGVTVRDALTGEVLTTLSGFNGELDVFLLPDGQTVVTSEQLSDSTWQVRWWNSATGELLQRIEGTGKLAAAVAPDDSRTIATVSSNLKDQQQRTLLQIWDARTGELRHQLTTDTPGIDRYVFSPNGSMVALSIFEVNVGRRVELWDVVAGQQRGSIVQKVEANTFSPDGTLFFAAHALWDCATGEARTYLSVPVPESAAAVQFSPDGKTLAIAGLEPMWNRSNPKREFVKLYDVATGQERVAYRGGGWPNPLLAFSPDGKRLAHSRRRYSKSLRIWDTESRLESLRLQSLNRKVRSLKFSDAGRTLTARALAGKRASWNLSDGRMLDTPVPDAAADVVENWPDGLKRIAASSDGNRVCLQADDQSLRLWDVPAGKETARMAATGPASFTPDGRLLITGGITRQQLRSLAGKSAEDGIAKIEQLGTPLTVWDTETGQPQFELPESRHATRLIFAEKGTTVLGLCSSIEEVDDEKTGRTVRKPRTVGRFWDLSNGELHGQIKGPGDSRVMNMELSRDGTTLAIAAQELAVMGRKTVTVFDTRKAEQRFVIDDGGLISAFAFAVDGQTIATASDDGFLRFWDPVTGNERTSVNCEQGPLTTVAFSPDGKTLAVGAKDGSVTVWKAHDWQ